MLPCFLRKKNKKEGIERPNKHDRDKQGVFNLFRKKQFQILVLQKSDSVTFTPRRNGVPGWWSVMRPLSFLFFIQISQKLLLLAI